MDVMIDPQLWARLTAIAALLIPIFPGAYAIWSPDYRTGEMTWRPAGRRRSDGTRERPTLSKMSMAFHLMGEHPRGDLMVRYRLGVYPLVNLDECWFVAADIDDHDGVGDIRRLIEQLWQIVPYAEQHGITVYVEVSGGGHGVHLWIFFSEPVKALKARRLMYRLICAAGFETMLLHGFDGGGTFDRLFPAQDSIKEGQFGNLIALPHNNYPDWDEGKSIILNLGREGVLPSDGTWPLVRPALFARTVTRHSATDVEAALESLRLAGCVQEPPKATTKKRGLKTTSSKYKPGSKKRTASGPSQKSEYPKIDWQKFLDDNNIDYDLREGRFAYLEICPYKGEQHTHSHTFWIDVVTGFGECWGADCECVDGVNAKQWCKKLGLKPPWGKRRRTPRRRAPSSQGTHDAYLRLAETRKKIGS